MAVRHGKILSQLTVFAILSSFLTGVSSAMTLAVGHQLAVSFVAVGQSAAEVTDFFGDRVPPYSILPDPNGEVSTRYAVKRIPLCVFIDETGLIQYVGRFKELIVWRLPPGEQILYP